ncbi:MAG: hypothetical protein IJA09_05700 [Bacteroidales bacterium]|nr:hypothetical protein [Bacteroidales bacterium]MBR2475289.1 hypothetical protein [Bacteroidaceae bacterium]MBR3609035.1 hypothetical protein [Bacteroidales bacterium]
MISFIIWLLGLILCIKAVLDIWKMPMSGLAKVLAIIILLLTSWIGLAIYYFVAKDKLPEWFKNIK